MMVWRTAGLQALEGSLHTTATQLLSHLADGLRFPARLRVLLDARDEPALTGAGVDLRQHLEWRDLEPGLVQSAACGVAEAERERGGRVVVLTSRPLDASARQLVRALDLPNLWFMRGAGAAPSLERVTREGALERVVAEPPALPPSASWQPLPPASPVRREWPAVHLPSLPIHGRPPWPSGGTALAGPATAPAAVAAALHWLGQREARLLLPHLDPRWCHAGDDEGTLIALAHLASEGRRVVWQVPGGRLGSWQRGLSVIATRGLAMKVIVDGADLPELGGSGVSRWWVASSADPAEAGAVLAQMLVHEDPCLLGLVPKPAAGAAAYSPHEPWRPGAGRWLSREEPGKATVICSAGGAGASLAVCQAAGSAGAAVFQCTSLLPLPLPELRRMVASGPLIVFEPGSPPGFATAVAACLAPTRVIIASHADQLARVLDGG